MDIYLLGASVPRPVKAMLKKSLRTQSRILLSIWGCHNYYTTKSDDVTLEYLWSSHSSLSLTKLNQNFRTRLKSQIAMSSFRSIGVTQSTARATVFQPSHHISSPGTH